MPATKPRTLRADRPSAKERAASLRSAVTRSAAPPAPPADMVPPSAQPNPELVRLIREHNELLGAGNEDVRSNVISDALFNTAFRLFNEACDFPASTPADLLAKFGMIEVELRDAVEGHGSMAKHALEALAADLRCILHAESLKSPEPIRASKERDLSGCTLPQLRALHETVRGLWHSATAELEAPWCWDKQRENYNAAGNVLSSECDGMAGMLDAIVEEARRRDVDENGFRDDRLELLIRSELSVEGRIIDRGLLAEIAEAWGPAPRT